LWFVVKTHFSKKLKKKERGLFRSVSEKLNKSVFLAQVGLELGKAGKGAAKKLKVRKKRIKKKQRLG